MNEKDAIAMMAANLKGPKIKYSNLLEFAEACDYLIKKWKSVAEVARFFDVSDFMIRQINRINTLSTEAKGLVGEGRIGIDTAYWISRIDFDERKQNTVAKYVVENEVTSKETRILVDMIISEKKSDLSPLLKKFEEIRPKNREVHVLVVPIAGPTFSKFRKLASSEKLSPHDLVLKLIEEYIDAQKEER